VDLIKFMNYKFVVKVGDALTHHYGDVINKQVTGVFFEEPDL